MGLGDDIKNSAKDATGKVKESVGDLTNNQSLENQGKVDQATAKVQQVGDDLKDAGRDATR